MKVVLCMYFYVKIDLTIWIFYRIYLVARITVPSFIGMYWVLKAGSLKQTKV